jgi:hypothetical protein
MTGQAGHITKPQIRKLHASARELGIDYGLLHDLVREETWKESIRDLSREEASRIIERLVSYGASPGKMTERRDEPRRRRASLPSGVTKLATANQRRYIAHLERELGWEENPERLRGFTWRIIKQERVRTVEEGQRLILAMKAMVARKQKEELEAFKESHDD